jgi:hypothetical protein
MDNESPGLPVQKHGLRGSHMKKKDAARGKK